MRWPGPSPVLAVSRSGAQWSRKEASHTALGGSAALVVGGAVGVRLGAGPDGAEWSGTKWKADKSGALLAEQGSCFSRCYARPSERASDGRVKSWTLARRSSEVCGVRVSREPKLFRCLRRLALLASSAPGVGGGGLDLAWC